MKSAKTNPPRKMAAALPSTFTVRDMSRRAATVLRASLAHGQVRIRSRGGPVFLLTPDKTEELVKERAKAAADFAARQREYRERLRALGSRPALRKDMERINRIIAGAE